MRPFFAVYLKSSPKKTIESVGFGEKLPIVRPIGSECPKSGGICRCSLVLHLGSLEQRPLQTGNLHSKTGGNKMAKHIGLGMLVTASLVVTGCQKTDENASSEVVVANTWPETLTIVGTGFPNAGDPCRVIGETAATVNYLDDSATLAGCLTADDAAKLGGQVVGEVDGVTLVSVPRKAMTPGDGDSQGDAKVAGTIYNATAQVRCSGYKGAAAGMCDAGVVRNTETGTYVDITLPGDAKRTIFFNKDGSFLSFSTAEADGTSKMKAGSTREGDTTIATLGSERYEIPDVFVKGD